MTETPYVLSETPGLSADLLSDLLGNMHIAATVLFRAEFREPWSVITPQSCQLAQVLPFRTEHIIPFHVVAAGGCWLGMPEREPVWLEAGSAMLLPYGDGHLLGGRDAAQSVHISGLLPPPPWREIPVVAHGGSGSTTSIVCGFLECDELLFHPILRHLPALLRVDPVATPAGDWLAGTMRHTAAESAARAPGSRSMLSRLTELMFAEVLRNHMKGLSADDAGWFAACNDPVVGGALKLLHATPMRDWSVETLAHQVGVSRTVLAERFKRLLEQPPMQYLARWRMQLAAQQLKAGDAPIKTLADRAGYESEASFSRAFKRQFGLAPAAWRRQVQR